MWTGKKQLIAAYFSFTGIPIFALVCILDAGHHLQAAAAVGGDWEIQADLPPPASAPCAVLPAQSPQLVMTIVQSGKSLALAVGRMEGAGRIENATVTAYRLRPVHGSTCLNQDEYGYLQANLQGPSGHDLLDGVLRLNGCLSCPAVHFRATRHSPAHLSHP